MALGEKRNGSVFATAAQRRDAAEYQVTSEPEAVPVVVDDTPQRTLNTDIGTLGRAHNLFFTPSAEGRDFNSVLQEVQEYISGAYAALITEGGEDAKEQLMRYITKYHYTLSGIKSRTVGDGQHGTARWATDKEIRKTYAHVPFKVRDWRKGVSLPTEQGLVLGCKGKKDELTALVDSDDIHCLMIAASGAGKTAFFLYPNLEYPERA